MAAISPDTEAFWKIAYAEVDRSTADTDGTLTVVTPGITVDLGLSGTDIPLSSSDEMAASVPGTLSVASPDSCSTTP